MSRALEHLEGEPREPAGDDALIGSLEALLATARTQLGELRSTLGTAIDFARAQDHPQ